MRLIGMLDSPYVRRVAIGFKLLGIAFDHESVSVFRHFDAFREINPVVKAPTLVLDDGSTLMESTLILEYLQLIAPPGKRLVPVEFEQHRRMLKLNGLALAACDKTVQIVYEHELRPAEKQHQPWLDRVSSQLHAAYAALEQAVADAPPSLEEGEIDQSAISIAVAWSFSRLMLPEIVLPATYPALQSFTERAEQLPAFVATPML